MSKVEERLRELGLTLPPPPPPMADYCSYVRDGDMLYLAGNGPLVAGVCPEEFRGRVGREVSVEKAQEAAALTALNVLSVLKAAAGDLDRVRLLRVLGFVRCPEDFGLQPRVIDGFSTLMRKVMGERGGHSRVALGTNALPFDTPLEIEVFAKILSE